MDEREEFCEEITNKLCRELSIDRPMCVSLTVTDRIREIVIAKLCKVINIRCQYNYKNEFFYFFASIVGDVLVNKMGYKVSVASASFKFFRYDGINLVESVTEIFKRDSLDSAFLSAYYFLDKFDTIETKVKKYN